MKTANTSLALLVLGFFFTVQAHTMPLNSTSVNVDFDNNVIALEEGETEEGQEVVEGETEEGEVEEQEPVSKINGLNVTVVGRRPATLQHIHVYYDDGSEEIHDMEGLVLRRGESVNLSIRTDATALKAVVEFYGWTRLNIQFLMDGPLPEPGPEPVPAPEPTPEPAPEPVPAPEPTPEVEPTSLN